MDGIKQMSVSAHYNYASQQVEFLGDDGVAILSIPMSSIMEIAADIKPVYTIVAKDPINRKVSVVYVPINEPHDRNH